MKFLLFFLLILSCFCYVDAQTNEGGIPLSFSNKAIKEIPITKLPQLDLEKLRNEADSENTKTGIPFEFAKVFEVELNLLETGVWDTIGEKRICRLAIQSKGAYSLNLTFSPFKLPAKSNLYLYDRSKKYILGAFTDKNNSESLIFPTEPVPGEVIIMDYEEPLNTEFHAQLTIQRIGHDYKGIFLFPDITQTRGAHSAACEVNINCPAGDDWQVDKRSVCKIIVNNKDICSGSLINNTANNGAPYFLTANHCVNTQLKAAATVFFFNYESPTCQTSMATSAQTLSGADLVATAPDEKLDFALLKLHTIPPENYKPYYAGWNRTTKPPQKTTCIHHPDGDIKKIAIDEHPPIIDNYGSTYIYESHWRVQSWETGVTEGGSSGSPLFDENHRIIGSLTGGRATCNNLKDDYFSMLNMEWSFFNLPGQSLRTWLDPSNSTVETLNGYDPYYKPFQVDASLMEIVVPTSEYCNLDIFKPTVKIQNRGEANLSYLKIYYQIDGGKIISQVWSGMLVKNAVTVVELQPANLTEGKHTFKTYISEPNMVKDQNNKNDTLSKQFQSISGEIITMELTTDNFGYETYWMLKNQNNEILYSNDNYLDKNTVKEYFCLRSGCYTYTIFDRGKDGICCNNGKGSLILSNQTDNQIIGEAKSFKEMQQIDFCINSTRSTLDVSMEGIIAPTDRYCTAGQIKPQVVIKNMGTETISSYTIRCYIDQVEKGVLNWTGILPAFDLDTITMPSVNLVNGEHTILFKVEFKTPLVDQNLMNNQMEKICIVGNAEQLILNIQTDLYASETTWSILDVTGKTVVKGGPYRDGFEQKITEPICLPKNECYKFIINDSSGDGICCGWSGNGNFVLKNLVSDQILAQGSDFGAQVIKDFCMWTNSVPENNIETEFMIFPNPSNGIVKIQTSIPQKYQIEIYNLLGKKLLNENVNTKDYTLNLTSFNENLVFLKITSEKGVINKKLIITR